MSAKIQEKSRNIQAEIEKIKSDKELFNALKAEANINSAELKQEFDIEINNNQDIHFKKAMLLSAQKFSNIAKMQKLKMHLESDKIIISKA